MFTPQRKGWAVSGWQENGSASRKNPRSSLGVVLGRGKGVIGAEETPVPPPQGLLGEKDGERAGIGVDGSSSEDWKRFRESGLLDEKVQLRKNKEVLAERVSALEIERDECLYSMGLLLIEKNEWSSQIEELRQALVEAQEILTREQTAHIIVVSELEKREENLKKALGIEKQCVVDLEKALREMRAEVSETKFISENKLANAHALQVSLEEKQLEIESKVHAADARLAEANRKNSEVDRKLEDLEAREHKVQRELSSLNIERKAIEKDLSKQREHLLEWEKELQEKQRRLLDEQKLINEREERANDVDMILKKKEVEIEEARKKIDATSGTLKSQEDDFKVRVRALTVKEKGVEIKSSNLEKKEKDLMAVEEKLNAREREEIQKLLDEHKAILDAKKEDFELEMTKKRRSFDEEAKNRMDMLDKDKSLVKRKEEHLLKREKALDIEADDLKSKEKDLDSKSKALKKWEDSLKSDEKLFQEQRKQLLKDSSEIESSRAKLHNEKVAIEAEGQKVIFEKENLKLTQEEREQHLKLQTELKLEKDECQMMMVSLEKQKEALRQEREMFERDWEVLDEKRVALEIEVKQLSAEREKLEKWRHNEEESLKKECLEARADMQRELEDLRLKKVTFEKMMAQERSGAHAEVEKERADMSREFELFKHGLEMSMQRKQDDVEKNFQEKKNEFERWREVELSHIKSSSESNDLKLRRLEMEQNQLLREKEEFSDQGQKLEADRQEIQKDINTLLRLSKNLKDQREEFAKEKEIFLSAAEQCKACHNCGVPINNFDLLNFQPLGGSEDSEEVLLPSLTDGFLEEHAKVGSTDTSHGVPVAGLSNSGSHMKSWFQRCTGLFKISPRNNMHPPTEDQAKTSFGERLDRASLEDADYEPAPSASFENQMVHFDSGDVVPGELERVGITGDDAEASFGVADSSMDIVIMIDSDNGTQKTALVSDDDNNEVEGSSMHAEKDSQPEPFKQGHRHQPSRRAKSKPIRRTHSVRAVVEEAKAFLGEISEIKTDEQRDGGAKGSQNILNENPDAPVKFDGAVTSKEQKRRLGELEPEGSGPHSDAEASFGVADNSMDIVRIDADNGTRKTAVVTDDENNEVEGSSMQAEDSQPEPSKQGKRHQPNRRAKSKPIRRTLSVKAVVEDAKSFLGEVSELKIDEQQNGGTKDSQNIPDDNPEAPVKPDGAVTSKRQKRRLGELEPEGSESHSENLSIGQRVKKRQTSSQPTTPRNKRYNLRNTTVANTAAASQGTPHKKGAANAGSLQLLPESNIVAGGQTESNIMEGGLGAERSSFHDPQPSASLEYSEKLLQKSAVQCVMEIQSEKIVQHESQEVNDDGIVIKSVEFIEQIAKDGDDVEGDNGIAVAEQIAEDGDEVDGDDKLDEFSEEMAEDGEEVDADAADTPSDWGSGSEDEDDGHSEKHTSSIGKKLWDFFTT